MLNRIPGPLARRFAFHLGKDQQDGYQRAPKRRIEFNRLPNGDKLHAEWSLDLHRAVPGSYALHAMATVRTPQRADRRFSMFRFTRYEPSQLAQCLRELGWGEIDAQPYAGDYSLRLYRFS
jgi:hypothetical protein